MIIINAHVIAAIVMATIIEMACLYKDIRTYSPFVLIFSEIVSVIIRCMILYHTFYQPQLFISLSGISL